MNMPVTEKTNAAIYPKHHWENYARLFLSVTTSIQLEVYKEASKHLSGDVADFGCGTAKISPFLADKESVTSYTGIDYASEMTETAQWVIDTIEKPNFKVQTAKIEEANGFYTSGVSIQSYYAWPEPLKTLQHIASLLEKDALFVLATPNQSLQLEVLAKDIEKELIGHPNLQAYKEYNLKLAANTDAHFIDMVDLITQVQEVGFGIVEAHQRFFKGGLNYLLLRRL